MDVLFINAQDALELRKEVNGQLLLGTLLLQADFDVDVLRFCQVDGFKGDYDIFIQNMIQKILSFNPKAVSFYSLWPDYHIMLRIARELKAVRPEIYTVFGGPQASATAQDTMEAMPYVDFICSSEGENTVVPFFTALLRNNEQEFSTVPGLYYRKNDEIIHHNLTHPLCELNELPFWDDRLYIKHYSDNHENYQSKNYYFPIDAGRGCPFNCTFCSSSNFWRRTYRLKNAERIYKEINYFKSKFNITSFRFSHDAFTVNKKLIGALCQLLIQNNANILWKCTSRVDCIDENLIIDMKNAGLKEIELGVESGSEKIQKCINKKLNLNNVQNIVRYILANQIDVDLYFMYGFPEENEEDILKTLDLMFDLLDMGITYSSMSLCRFFPKTKITDENINNLVFDLSTNNLFRGNGVQEELEIIRTNKAIFSMYYDLDTDVRKKYKFVSYLIYIYRKYPITLKYMREYYKSSKKLYEEFHSNNASVFFGFGSNVENQIKRQSSDITRKIINKISLKYKEIILDILRFEDNMIKLSEDDSISETIDKYNFIYDEIKSNYKLEALTEKTTILYIYKKNKITYIQSIN